jgi:hypothetical protein
MDREFRAGVLSSMLAAGLIVALTLLALMEPSGRAPPSPHTLDVSAARERAPAPATLS